MSKATATTEALAAAEVPFELPPPDPKTARDILGKLFTEHTIKLPVFAKEVKIEKVSLRTMKPILDLLSVVMAELKLTMESLPSFNLRDPALIMKLISTHYDEVIGIAVSLSNVTKEDLLDMDIDESVMIVQSIMALNKHFFMTKVLPSLRMLETVGANAEG